MERLSILHDKGEDIMVCENITVSNPSGIHMRPASVLSKVCGGLKSDIAIVKGEKKVDPKSVLILMSAAIKCGETIQVICEGETEEEDLKVILEAINSGLGE